ncbi:hypothetical protein BH10PSE16_BH10PSE16_33240 [soil metagenome]
MKKLFVFFCLWGGCELQAQPVWFNVMGNPADETVNTIEVDPTPVSISGGTRIMRIRVSRSADRVNWDGVPYRSYVSEVLFDCASNTARYVSIDYYKPPAWKGEPYQRILYSQSEPRLMQFRDVEPNPYKRIIRAACQTASITNN